MYAIDEWSKIYYFVTNNLRKVVGLEPLPGYRSKRWYRLDYCKTHLCRLVPSVTGMGLIPQSPTDRSAATAGAGAQNAQLRDFFTGKLTSHGRDELLRGNLRFQVQDVLHPRVLSVDPLVAPYCSYEWSALVLPTIRISK